MDNSGMFGEILEQGRNTAQNMRKAVVQGASQTAKTAVGQVTGSGQPAPAQQGSNEAANKAAQKQMSDDQAKQFLKDLYGPSKPQGTDAKNPQKTAGSGASQSLIQQAAGITPRDSNEGKKPEEIAHMQSLRSTLHQEYYQNLINPQKPEEESVTEKLEQEEQVKQLEEIEKQKKKPDPLAAVKKGTGETMVGASG